MAKGKYIVKHNSLYMRGAGGKLQKMGKGTELTLEDSKAKTMVKKGMIASLKDAAKVDVETSKQAAK
jgi:hypothetical protein